MIGGRDLVGRTGNRKGRGGLTQKIRRKRWEGEGKTG